MKKLLIVALLIAFAIPAYAALTAEEETFVGQLFTNKQKLIDLYQRSTELSTIADNVTSETIPIEMEKLRQQLKNVLAQRNADKDAVDAQAVVDKNAVDASYQAQIDQINTDLSIYQSQLDALLP